MCRVAHAFEEDSRFRKYHKLVTCQPCKINFTACVAAAAAAEVIAVARLASASTRVSLTLPNIAGPPSCQVIGKRIWCELDSFERWNSAQSFWLHGKSCVRSTSCWALISSCLLLPCSRVFDEIFIIATILALPAKTLLSHRVITLRTGTTIVCEYMGVNWIFLNNGFLSFSPMKWRVYIYLIEVTCENCSADGPQFIHIPYQWNCSSRMFDLMHDGPHQVECIRLANFDGAVDLLP